MASDFEITVLRDLSEIKATAVEAATTVSNLDTRLFHVQSGVISTIQSDISEVRLNIKELQNDAQKQIWWERFKMAIAPTLVGLHMLFRKLGLNV